MGKLFDGGLWNRGINGRGWQRLASGTSAGQKGRSRKRGDFEGTTTSDADSHSGTADYECGSSECRWLWRFARWKNLEPRVFEPLIRSRSYCNRFISRRLNIFKHPWTS